MSIQMRSYRDADLPYLQRTVANWIQQVGDCGYYHPGNIAHRIYEGFSGAHPRYDLVQVWENGEEIIGFAYSFVFDAAFFVFSSPPYRGSAVEQEMVQTAIATTQRYMAETKQEDQTIITDVYDCDQTRIDLLTRLGFARYRTWDWITERSVDEPAPAPVVPVGFMLRGATMADAEGLAAIRNNAFGGSWTGDVYAAQVMGSPGYRPAREIIVVAPDGRVAAFAVIHVDVLNEVGLFEPVGTHSDFRRLGLARAVMLHGLQEMRHQGMAVASVAHTADNIPARDLYHSLGFRKKYTTLGFQEVV